MAALTKKEMEEIRRFIKNYKDASSKVNLKDIDIISSRSWLQDAEKNMDVAKLLFTKNIYDIAI